MNYKQFLLLLFISGLWGGSFVFMKILTPVFGPILTSSLRLMFASIFLFVFYYFSKFKMKWKGNIKFYLIIGVLNSAIPFILYSFASLHIDASLSVVLNSTSPMFGALFGYLLLSNKLSKIQVVGLLVGSIGVIIVTSITLGDASIYVVLSILSCILAALLYGFSGSYIKKYTTDIDSISLTLGSLFFGSLVLLPFAFFFNFENTIEISHILLLIIFGIMGTSVPYLIYYKLIKDIGSMKALTVTYLMPVFGVMWAFIILNEVPKYNVYLGSIVILIGVYLVTYKPKKLV